MKAYGKAIITGEHSVVYGYPALAMRLPLYREIKLVTGFTDNKLFLNILDIFAKKFALQISNISFVESGNLPIGSGLGSSAAFAAATCKALARKFKLKISQAELFDLVQESEQFAHGNPSGVDAATVVYGGLIKFQKVAGQMKITKLKNNFLANYKIELINSGQPLETTKDMVELVAKKMENPAFAGRMQKYLQAIGQISEAIINNFDLKLISQNQKLLEKIGVVGKKAKEIIKQLSKKGVVAKITGAGGVKSGSGMIISLCT